MVRERLLKVVVAVCAAGLLAGCAGLWETSGSGATVDETVMHTVAPGETLREIADDYYGDPDAAAYLAEVNGIPAGAALVTGAVVDVPVGESDLERYRDRTEAKSHYNRGTALAAAGELARAEESFRRALAVDPRFVDAAYNLGVVLLSRGEATRAALVLEQTAAVRPGDAEVHFALGKALFECSRPEAATESFRRAVALDPGLEEAVYAVGLSLLRSGRRQDGIVALDRYLRRFPDGRWAEEARRRLAAMAREDAGGAGGVEE